LDLNASPERIDIRLVERKAKSMATKPISPAGIMIMFVFLLLFMIMLSPTSAIARINTVLDCVKKINMNASRQYAQYFF